MPILVTRTPKGKDHDVAAPASAPDYTVIYQTAKPCGMIPCWGADVCERQSVAVRFVPEDSGYYLKRIGLWFMTNSAPGVHPEVTVTLRNDDSAGGESRPGQTVLETWTMKVTAENWIPVREEMESVATPYLERGTRYWIAAESKVECGDDGVWTMAGVGSGFSSINQGPGKPWDPGSDGAVPATIVWGLPPLK